MNLPADPPPDHRTDPAEPDDGSRDRAARRRHLDRIFGEVLPEVTGDERGSASSSDRLDRDRWYNENRPPHHG